MRAVICLSALALLSACGKSTEEQRAADAADVEAVKAAQSRLPPIVPIRPEPLTQEDVARIDATGPGCEVHVGDAMGPPVFIQVASYGWIKRDDLMTKVAADTGSERAPGLTWTRYTGKDVTVRVEYVGGDAVPTGDEGLARSVVMTIRDAYDRVVYRGAGVQNCSS